MSLDHAFEKLEPLPYRLEPPIAKGRIGLIVLSTDETGEDAFRTIIPASAARVFTTRTGYSSGRTSPGVLEPTTSFRIVADSLPVERPLDVLAFSCTSATVAAGVSSMLDQLAEARPGVRHTSPGLAALRALKALDVRRIALLTPYSFKVHNLFVPFFNREGFEVAAHATFDLDSDATIGELSRDSIFDAAKRLCSAAPVDALFVSCTATPVVPLIDDLEKEVGVAVVSSSQAMAWDALRLIQYSTPMDGFGSLLRQPR